MMYPEEDFSSDSEAELMGPIIKVKKKPPEKWDLFYELPNSTETGSAAKNPWFTFAEKCLLVSAYVLTFIVVFVSAVVSKGTAFFMISQIGVNRSSLPFCNGDQQSGYYISNAGDKQFEVAFQCDGTSATYECSYNRSLELAGYYWCLFFAYAFPNVAAFFRSLRMYLFKAQRMPGFLCFLFVAVMEACHAVGLALFVFQVLPRMDSLRGMILTTGFATLPAFLKILFRGNARKEWKWLLLDIPAFLIQVSISILWPALQYWNSDNNSSLVWALPLSLVLISFGWWETFVDRIGLGPLSKWLLAVRKSLLRDSRYSVYSIVSPLKIAVFFGSMVLIAYLNESITGGDPALNFTDIFFSDFLSSFGNHTYTVTEIIENSVHPGLGTLSDAFESKSEYFFPVSNNLTKVFIMIIHIGTSYATYVSSKFASKVQIQLLSFALPLSCVIPACFALLIAGCGARSADKCAFQNVVPENLFFECPKIGDFLTYIWEEDVWFFLIWFTSFLWVANHIWYPKSPRLASSEQIFSTPYYESLFIDQSIMLNRRKDKLDDASKQLNIDNVNDVEDEKPEKPVEDQDHINDKDRTTKIYACATMWHETKEEMIEMLKSLFRIDRDYSSRSLAKKYFGSKDPDYYEWETHILFDDCFEIGDNPEEAMVVNKFVRQLVETMNEAVVHIYGYKGRVKPCKKMVTPYGGRLTWTLPGKTKIICHLKNKDMIRHKKRWSQCMYMYYLLGYKLMATELSDDRKQIMAENTYLLALDGDIDFQPEAIIKLVDLMKKNKNVGAACGRIHPTGSGFMPWFQMFEYAVGHWFQKATEHVLGCVLCSPGCFSLFRGQALMDMNVMRRYTTKPTEPRHYVQYDQGEDRWLCTLLLQQGWRVEYSAASDAYTACPISFEEFYNQRRRWLPSTIMNILDLLEDYENVVKNNPDISIFYIIYQGFLMFSTFIGPGSIYMILAGSFNTVFGITYYPDALLYNLIPVILFCFACYYLDSKLQLSFAKMLTIGYVLIMLAVMIGICIQIVEDGTLWSPSGLGFLSIIFSFVFAAIIHPYEFYCLPYFLIYWITVPSMYLLLVIYSLFNLWNVSWGTRETVQKKTKSELEQEKKELEEKERKAKQASNSNTVLSSLRQRFNLGGGGSGDSGGMEFSLANLFKCMCFTHDDPKDPKHQLANIMTSLDKIERKITNIEGNHDQRRSSKIFQRKKTLPQIHENEEAAFLQEEDVDENSISNLSEDAEDHTFKRDEKVNPFWIEDFYVDRPDLCSKETAVIRGTEKLFWERLIEKYLKPIEMKKEDKKEQQIGLKDYRDRLVFTFIMVNTLWVLLVTLMQQQKDLFAIDWPIDAKYNISYTYEQEIGAVLRVDTDALVLEPIGLMFMVAFLGVLVLQLIGMIMHRWTNVCHTIATTRLDLCEITPKTATDTKDVVSLVKNMQMPVKDPVEKENFVHPQKRRNTVAMIKLNNEEKEEDDSFELEQIFVKNTEHDIEAIAKNRKLSLRRQSIDIFNKRRVSISERRMSQLPRYSRDSTLTIEDSDSNFSGYSDRRFSYSGLPSGNNTITTSM